MFTEPTFPARQFQRIKTQLLTFLSIQAQDTAAMADQAFDRAIYRASPLRYPELGFPHTLQMITREDLKDFHQRFLGPKGMVVAICGGVQPEEALGAFERSLGAGLTQPNSPAGTAPVEALQGIIREHVTLEEKSQTDR